MSARRACREIFGDKFPNVHRTLGNLYKKKYNESIGLAKKLSLKARQERRKEIEESDPVLLPRPGNPAVQAYLTKDEEELIVSFLQTCNFMHMPFNRDAFKVSICMHSCTCSHTLITHTFSHACSYTHSGPRCLNCAGKRPPHESGGIKLLRQGVFKTPPLACRIKDFKCGSPPCKTSYGRGARCGLSKAAGLYLHIYILNTLTHALTHSRTHGRTTLTHPPNRPCSTVLSHRKS